MQPDTPGLGFGYDPLLEELHKADHPMLQNRRAVRLYGDARELADVLHTRSYKERVDIQYFRPLWDIVDDLHDELHGIGLELPDYFRDCHDGVTSLQQATIGYVMMLLDHVKPHTIRQRQEKKMRNPVL